jgi:hypothetical protein
MRPGSVLHIIAFIWACIQTHKLRMQAKRERGAAAVELRDQNREHGVPEEIEGPPAYSENDVDGNGNKTRRKE